MRKQNLMLFPPEIAAEFVAEQEGFKPMAYKCPGPLDDRIRPCSECSRGRHCYSERSLRPFR